MKTKLLIVFLIFAVTACNLNAPIGAAPTPTGTPVIVTEAPACPTATSCPIAVVDTTPTATNLPDPIATPQSCAQNWTRTFSWDNDMDWGDANLITQYYASDQSGHQALVRIQEGWSVDTAANGVTFTGESIQTANTVVLDCLAEKYLAENPNAVKVWVGTSPDEGWQNASADFWSWTIWAYKGVVIDTSPATWTDVSLSKNGENRTFCAHDGLFVYGQVWDGSNLASTTDFIVRKGAVTIPSGLQGTIWVVTTNDADASVMARFVQMTYEEHVSRNELAGLLKTLFFGKGFIAPFNWEHLETDWNYVETCTTP